MLGRIDVSMLNPKRQRHESVRERQLGTCLTSRWRERTSLDASARTLNIYSYGTNDCTVNYTSSTGILYRRYQGKASVP